MTQFVNVSSFAGTAGVGIATSDAGWEVNYQAGSTSAVVSDAARARQNEGTEIYYSRTETPPGLTQVVSSTIRRFTAVTGSNVGVYARAYASRSCIVAQLRTESGGTEVRLYKIKGGTATQLGSSVSVTTTNGADHTLAMEVSGTAPIEVNVKFNGSSILNPTFTDADFNVAGKVGIRFGYGTGLATNSTGLHIASFTADDTIGGGSTPVAFTGTVSDQTGTEGTAFSLDTSTYFSGTETPFSYSVQAGTLPTGLSLNSSTGVISGTPTTAGVSSGIVIRATDATPDTADTNAFSITIDAANTAPTFDGPSIAAISGTEAVALTSLDVSGLFSDAESSLTFSAVGTWPAGVTVSSVGIISGTPTTAGTYGSLQVRATDAGALTADSNTFSITVAAPPAIGVNVANPLKNNTGTLRASESGIGVALLTAADFTYGNTTDAAGLLNTITGATAGETYYVAILAADGGVGITGPIVAS